MFKRSAAKLAPFAATNRTAMALFRSLRCQFIPIFMLHRMSDPSRGVVGHDPKFLRLALSYLKNKGFNFVSLQELVNALNGEGELPEYSVCFTCDDGFYDQIQFASPIFKEFKCPATIFLLTDFMDGQSWPWDYQVKFIIEKTKLDKIPLCETPFSGIPLNTPIEKKSAISIIRNHLKLQSVKSAETITKLLGNLLNVPIEKIPPAAYSPISWSEARNAEDEFISFGPHSQSHAILSHLDEETARSEIEGSFTRMKQELNNPLPIFCFPTGRTHIDFTERDMQLAKQAGFVAALSTTPGYVSMNKDRFFPNLYCLKRFSFPKNLADLTQYASWIECAKEKMRSYF